MTVIDIATGEVMAFEPVEQGTAAALRARAIYYERAAHAARAQVAQLEASTAACFEEIARRAAEGARLTMDPRARLFFEDIAARAALKSAA